MPFKFNLQRYIVGGTVRALSQLEAEANLAGPYKLNLNSVYP